MTKSRAIQIRDVRRGALAGCVLALAVPAFASTTTGQLGDFASPDADHSLWATPGAPPSDDPSNGFRIHSDVPDLPDSGGDDDESAPTARGGSAGGAELWSDDIVDALLGENGLGTDSLFEDPDAGRLEYLLHNNGGWLDDSILPTPLPQVDPGVGPGGGGMPGVFAASAIPAPGVGALALVVAAGAARRRR